MSTTAKVVLIGGLGAAAFLYFRSQQAQQSALLSVPSGPSTGGGVGGAAQRVWNQWKSDPLGIANTKAALGTAKNVLVSGAQSVGGAVHSVTSFVGGLF